MASFVPPSSASTATKRGRWPFEPQREKAVALAAPLGQKVGEPHSIQENASGWWSGYNAWWGGRWGPTMAQNVIQEAAGSNAPGDDLAVGQITVRARVTVSFYPE